MYNFRDLDGRKVETRRRAANKRIGQHVAGAGLKAWMVGLVGVVALGVVLFLTLVPRSQRGNRIPVFPHGHRYIFVASPGRAGSGFLRNVFGNRCFRRSLLLVLSTLSSTQHYVFRCLRRMCQGSSQSARTWTENERPCSGGGASPRKKARVVSST